MACLWSRWSKIASHFPGRTDNEIKNHWNTRIKKRLKLLGLDPVTHKPIDNNNDHREKNPIEEEEENQEDIENDNKSEAIINKYEDESNKVISDSTTNHSVTNNDDAVNLDYTWMINQEITSNSSFSVEESSNNNNPNSIGEFDYGGITGDHNNGTAALEDHSSAGLLAWEFGFNCHDLDHQQDLFFFGNNSQFF